MSRNFEAETVSFNFDPYFKRYYIAANFHDPPTPFITWRVRAYIISTCSRNSLVAFDIQTADSIGSCLHQDLIRLKLGNLNFLNM